MCLYLTDKFTYICLITKMYFLIINSIYLEPRASVNDLKL